VEPFFLGVCTLASSRRRDTRWLELVWKMIFIKNKAEEALEDALRGFLMWYKPEEVEDTVLEHVDD